MFLDAQGFLPEANITPPNGHGPGSETGTITESEDRPTTVIPTPQFLSLEIQLSFPLTHGLVEKARQHKILFSGV